MRCNLPEHNIRRLIATLNFHTTMKSFLLLSLLAQLAINSSAWIQFPKGQRVEVRLHMSEESKTNFWKAAEPSIHHDRIINLQNNNVIHVGGLFESLSPLPVYEWVVDPSSSEWDFGFHACVGDECEVSERINCKILNEYAGFDTNFILDVMIGL